MTKHQFLDKIKEGIISLTYDDIMKYLQYYSEMIDDRIEDGMSEQDAVSAMGDPDRIIAQILNDRGGQKEVPSQDMSLWEKIKSLFTNKETRPWIIVVLVLTSVVWVPTVFGVTTGGLGALIGLAGGVIGIFAGIYGAAIGLLGAFVGCVIEAIAIFTVGGVFAEGMLCLGIGLILGGIGVLLVLLGNLCVSLVVRFIKWLIGFIKEKTKGKGGAV